MAKKSSNAVGGPSEDWRVESDVRTLMQAEEIRDDPKRLKAAQKRAKEMVEDLQTINAETAEKEAKKK